MTKNETPKVPAFVIGEGVSITSAEREAITTALTDVRSGDYTADAAKVYGSKHAHYVGVGHKAVALRRVYGAVAFHVAISAGLIGTGEGQEEQQVWGKRYGMSKANVTALKSLGAALAKGYGPEFSTWSKASAKAGNAAVGKALREGHTGADIDVKVAAALTASTTPRKAASEKDETTPDATPETPATPVERDPAEVASAAVAFLDDFLKETSGSAHADAVLLKMVKIVKREQTLATQRRAAAAKIPA